MNLEIKKQWVDALRSGEYTQTKERLKDGQGHCCLGVLCDLAVKTGVGYWDNRNIFIGPDGLREDGDLPDSVKEWAGIKGSTNPLVLVNSNPTYLHILNDEIGFSFNEIAELIEEQL